MTKDPSTELARTPLHDLHLGLGAKMVPFAGYEMPLHYRSGLLKEHLHTRGAAGLFDVSHMGQISLTLPSGDPHEIAHALEELIPIDVEDLPVGRQRYGFLLDDAGGILDDLMVSNLGTRFIVVVNAANKHADFAHMRARFPSEIAIDLLPDALIAVQGPKAEAAMSSITTQSDGMAFMDIQQVEIAGASCVISRSGYTGEDGFELSIPASHAASVAESLLRNGDVLPVGLGARDSLRLEAGLCLHGSDIDAETTPVEAALKWAIAPVRRRGGARQGGFPGADRILDEIERGTSRSRVGLRAEGRLPVRRGAPLFDSETAGSPVGEVTSGCFGPSLEAPVAMGYVPKSLSEPGRRLYAEVRGQRVPIGVCRLPFLPSRFKRQGGGQAD